MSKAKRGRHAPEPLCAHCGEDKYHLVTAITDGSRVEVNCAVCGFAWNPNRRPESKVDLNGVVMTDP
jgi:ribosomal protein L37E